MPKNHISSEQGQISDVLILNLVIFFYAQTHNKHLYYTPVVLPVKSEVVRVVSVLGEVVSRHCRLRTNCVTPDTE